MIFGIYEPVTASIRYLLENHCIDDAIFLSERLHAEVASEESTFLLATSYFRNRQCVRAMHTLEKLSRSTPRSRLLLARCYLEQKEYAKVQHVVLENTGQSRDELPRLYQTDTGLAFWLVAESLRRNNLSEEAQEYFLLSLRINPYLWSSLRALCEGGHTVPLDEVYAAENCPLFCSEFPYMVEPPTRRADLSVPRSRGHRPRSIPNPRQPRRRGSVRSACFPRSRQAQLSGPPPALFRNPVPQQHAKPGGQRCSGAQHQRLKANQPVQGDPYLHALSAGRKQGVPLHEGTAHQEELLPPPQRAAG